MSLIFMNIKRFLIIAVTFSIITAKAVELRSPDGSLAVNIGLKDNYPIYTLTHKGRTILTESRLGLELSKSPITNKIKITEIKTNHSDTYWKPVYGERNLISDHYNELKIIFKEFVQHLREFEITFRAYAEGVAFCYTIPAQNNLTNILITKELSEFCFEQDYPAFAIYSAQGVYAKTPLSQIKPGCERPLPVIISHDLYIALAEAKLVDYARMKFAPSKSKQFALVSDLSGTVESKPPLTTPWRVVMVAESPAKLLENNFIILNLNDPCAIKDTSWIKPGKVIREVTLTTQGGKSCVDFALKRNLQYVEFDAGWYGPEFDPTSDARRVNVDPKRSKGPLNLDEVIQYATQKGIGIILYVNRVALEKQLDEILPLYQSWGVKGVKFGFVNVGSQKWTSWLHSAIRKAAEYKLMVDVHDEYRTTGYERTYPNLMTAEGVAGDETSPLNSQTLTILFSRYLAGPADNTICYYDKRVERNATHAYQLAKAVCLYSPWQFLYWYDRPQAAPQNIGGAGGSANVIGDEPELEFYDHCPTVWDETKVLHGKIGEYAVIARRSGEQWFIGIMNADAPQIFELPFNFLKKGQKYTAYFYIDDPSMNTRTKVRVEKSIVDSETIIKIPIQPRGGQAIRIVPSN